MDKHLWLISPRLYQSGIELIGLSSEAIQPNISSVKSSPSVPTGHIARPYTLSATINFGWLPSGSGRRDISAPWSRTGFHDNIELPLPAQGHP